MIATCGGYGTTQLRNGTKYTGVTPYCFPSLVVSRFATNTLLMVFNVPLFINIEHLNVLNEEMLYI